MIEEEEDGNNVEEQGNDEDHDGKVAPWQE